MWLLCPTPRGQARAGDKDRDIPLPPFAEGEGNQAYISHSEAQIASPWQAGMQLFQVPEQDSHLQIIQVLGEALLSQQK